MGGSKKQTIGYKYYLGMHMILCHGPIDFITSISVDKRKAWVGNSTGGSIYINAEGLFGGKKREGGVSGQVDIEMGRNDQGRNSYLQARLGSSVPAFRKVVGLVLRQCYLGLNPYLKPWGFRGQRIHVRQNGLEQWYDACAAIGTTYELAPVNQPVPWIDRGVNWFVIGASQETSGSFDTPAHQSWFKGYIDSVRVTKGVARYTQNSIAVPTAVFPENSEDPYWGNVVTLTKFHGGTATCAKGNPVTLQDGAVISTAEKKFGVSSAYFDGVHSWAKVVVGTSNQNLGGTYTIEGWIYMTEYVTNAHGAVMLSCGPLNTSGFDTGFGVLNSYIHHYQHDGVSTNQVSLFGVLGAVPTGQWVHLAFTRDGTTGMEYVHVNGKLATGVSGGSNMNPAHIIRECLTDPDWGMGYSDADIDDASFTYAANILYTEGMGMSILWDRQTPIEDFINEVVKHIAASVYVDRTTGKFCLKLIRGDYDRDDLLVLDESHIQKVEGATRPTAGELVNSVTAVYWDFTSGENGSVTVQDQALVQMQGAVINTTLQYPGFTNQEIASKAALRALTSLSIPLLSCTVYADRTASDLNIGDVFRMTWPDLQVNDLVMRVTAMALGDGKSNVVKLTVVEDVFATPPVAVVVIDPPPPGDDTDPSAPAGPAVLRVAMEVPYYEAAQQFGQATVDSTLSGGPDAGYVMAACARPNSELSVILQTDPGTGFEDVGSFDFCPAARISALAGRLDTVLSYTGGVDLDLVELGSWAALVTPTGAVELVRVDALDTVAGTVTVGRAVHDTVPLVLLPTTTILFLDADNGVDPTEYASGETIGVRMLPTSGSGHVPEESAPVDFAVLQGRAYRPYPPGDFKVNAEYWPEDLGAATELVLTWAHRDRVQQTGGVLIDFQDGSVGPEPGTTYTVEAYGIDPLGDETLFHSTTGITGDTHTVDLTVDVPPTDAVLVSVRLWSVRDGKDSLYHHRCDLSAVTAPYGLVATYTS